MDEWKGFCSREELSGFAPTSYAMVAHVGSLLGQRRPASINVTRESVKACDIDPRYRFKMSSKNCL